MIAPRDDLVALQGYHSPQIDVAVRLNTNESPLPPPPGFVDAYASRIATIDWHRYPDRAATELRNRIGAFHGVPPEMVFVANGSNEVIQTILLTYAGAGRTVATFEPTYQMHAQIARTVGAEIVQGQRGDDFTLDSAEIDRVIAAHHPHVTFLTSPNNPTGMVEPAEMIQHLLDVSHGLVVADEAYAQFADHSALDLVADDVPLVVTRTFSKTWGMASARLGYAIAPMEIVDELNKVVLPYHLDMAKQVAGTIALDYVDEMNQRVAFIVNERERVSRALAELPLEVYPSGANFILFRCVSVDAEALWAQLIEDDIMVRNCSGWPRLAGCLRVTIGTAEENDLFLAAVRRRLAESA